MAKTKRTKKQPKTVTLTLTEREARHLWWYLNTTDEQYLRLRKSIIRYNHYDTTVQQVVKEALQESSKISYQIWDRLDDLMLASGVNPRTPMKG